jgi:membrane-anchored protein YejM (alkaline phosphatase superfamily)
MHCEASYGAVFSNLGPGILLSSLFRSTLNAIDFHYLYHQIVPDDYARLVIQSYYAAVSYIDDLVGQLLSELRAVGLFNKTIILLIGDHGNYEYQILYKLTSGTFSTKH